MSVQLVVFDMAGTTVYDNNNVARAFQHAFAQGGIAITEQEVVPLMGYHKPEAITRKLEQLGIPATDTLVDKIHQAFEAEMLSFYEAAADVQPAPDAADLFRHLKLKGCAVALNTGFSKAIADTIVARFGWAKDGLVDAWVGSDEVVQGRPHPFMIRHLMERCSVDAVQAVAKVGDAPVDMEEGRNLGCRYVIGITTGAGKEAELQAAGATHIVPHLSAIPSIIEHA